MYAHIQFVEKFITFTHLGKEFRIKAKSKGNTIPIVSNKALKKVMKQSLFAYMIYVKDYPSTNVHNDFKSLNDNNQIKNTHE